MMMALGYFVFARITLSPQQMQHNRRWRHPQTSRIGARPASQYLGPDAENITIGGVLYPEITGGPLSLAVVEKMADTGKPYPLIDGSGNFFGLFVIEAIATTRSDMHANGQARRIEFTIDLLRKEDTDTSLLGYLNLPELDLGSDWAGLLNV